MCWTVYIGADTELPTVESEVLTVRPATDVPDSVKTSLRSRYIYDVGSYKGCACGFWYDSPAEHAATLAGLRDAPDAQLELEGRERARGVASVDALRDYLTERVRKGRAVLVYVSWYLDASPEPVAPEPVALDIFGGESFSFTQKALWLVDERGGRTRG